MNVAADLADSVRAALQGAGALREVKMFGGVGFMLNGKLIAGASGRGLLVRVGAEREHEALARPGARPMVMRGRTMVGYVYVDPPALDAASVAGWLRLAIPHVLALPARKRRRPARKAKAKAKSAAKPRPATKAKRTRARRAK